jgi:hypothetical protein
MKKSQVQKLIPVLKRRYITIMDAINIAGATAFHRRLTDIRKMGYITKDKWIKTDSGARVKAYKITGKL